MSSRTKKNNEANHARQLRYLKKGIVMLPKLRDEKKTK